MSIEEPKCNSCEKSPEFKSLKNAEFYKRIITSLSANYTSILKTCIKKDKDSTDKSVKELGEHLQSLQAILGKFMSSR